MSKFEHDSEKFGYLNLEDLAGVQNELIKLGYSPGDADGKYGPKTREAVKQFQTKSEIGIDGIVGSATRQALVDELNREAPPVAPSASS